MGRELASDPDMRLARPAAVPELQAFTCGGAAPWEVEVDEMVRSLAGSSLPPDGKLLIARDDGALVGLAHWARLTIRKYVDGVLVRIISLEASYRGARIGDPPQRVADLLLAEATKRIEAGWEQEGRPHIWAAVSHGNQRGAELFKRAGFDHDPSLSNAHFTWWWREGDYE